MGVNASGRDVAHKIRRSSRERVHEQIREYAAASIGFLVSILFRRGRGQDRHSFDDLRRTLQTRAIADDTAMAAVQDYNLVHGSGLASERHDVGE
jgi:hypothetical protein